MLDDTGLLDVVGQKHPLRRDVVRPKIICGASVAEIVRAMDLDTERFGLPVVRLIRGTEMSLVPISMWGKVRPKLGTRVEAAFPVRDPGSLALLASAALPSAATWAAGALGTAGIIGAAGTLSYALTVAAITVVGSLVINSLIPPAQQGGTRDPENYAITGTGNAINRRGVYPYVLGRHLMFPPMTATGFSETVGRDIYYRGRMTFGWGPVALEDLRIGSTPIWEYDGVELEFLNVDEARTLANMPQLADLVRPRTEEEHAPRKLLHAVGDLYEFQPAQAARSAVIAVEPTALRHGTVYSFVVEVAEAGVPGWTTVATYTDITTGQEFQADGFSDGVARRWRVRITNKRRLYEETTTLPFMRPESEGMTVTRASATYQVPAAGWRQGSEVMRLYSDDVAEDAYSDVPQENDPVIKYTRQETVSAAVDLTFPQGLYNSTFDGDLSSHRARFRFEYQRTEGGLNEADWVDLGETEWSGKYVSLYRVTKEIAFPAPDEYAIRITRTNGIDQDVGDVNSATLTAIRSIRDGKLPSHAGIAEVAFRIRANEQLNGRIDSLNAIVQQLAPELDSNLQWTEPRPVRHPAWLYAQALRGPHLRRPVTDDRIDLAALHAWATEEPHWTCDYVVDTATQLADVLDIICAAGRGRRTLADLRYSVVRDGAAGPVRQVFTPRNSWDYRSKLTFPREIHGFRCMVRSERLDWQEDEVLVLKDGYTRQTATELETLQLPGTVVTAEDADEGNTYRLGRYHLATALHRPETHSFKADWESIHIQQGDKIRLVHDVPLIGVGEARVKALTVENDLIISITLDDVFDLDQASFRMVVRNVSAGIHAFAATSPVDPQARVWTPTVGVIAGDVAVGDLVAIEETEQRSADMLVMAVRPDQDETALIEVVDAAPHVLDAASDIPPYDPVITNPRPPASDLPPAPVITAARSSQLTQIVLPDLSVRPRIAVQLAPIASRADLDGVTVQLRWREAGEDETPWTYGESVPAGEYSLLTGALEEGVRYLVEARTVGRAGKTRGWFAAPMQVTATTAAPAPPPIVASAVPASIPDANGSARRPAIRLSWVAPANRTLRVTWRLRVAGASEIGQRGLFAEASEGEVLIADGILPNTAYQIQASFVSGAADLRSWGGWMDVATPDIRLTVDDLDEDALSGGFDYPTAPANLALSTHLREDGAAVVNATWDAADPATGYEIEVAENGGGYVGTSSTTNAYALTVLPGTSLQIRVRAVNGPRRSDWVGPEAITAAVDTIPPAAPSGLTAEAGFGTVWLSWNANTEPDMAFYEIVEKANANAPAPNTTSPILTSTAATFARTGLNDDVTKYYWVRAVDTSGNRSSWSSMASATTPAPAGIDTEDLQGLIDETSFAAGLEGVRVVSGSTLPTTRSTSAIVFGGDLYRWNGTAYVKSVQAVDISGQVTGAQIADQALGTAKFANSIKPVEVLSALPGTPHVKGRQVFLTTNNKLYRNTGSGWIASVAAGDVTGKLTNAQIEALEAAKLTGQITGTQISDGAVSTPKLEANSVTTDKLLVTGRGSALNDDPNTSDASAWSAGDIVHPASPAVGPTALRSTKAYSFSRQFQVDESKQYRVRCVARPSSNANGDFFLRLYHYDANGNQISYNTVAHRPSFSGGWQVFDAIIDVPAGTVTASLNVILNHAGTQGYHEAQDVRCEEAVDSAVMVDGAVIARHIKTGEVKTDHLDANSVVAGKIGAGAVRTGELAAGAVTTSKMAIGDFTNLNTDRDFSDPSLWSFVGTDSSVSFSNAAPEVWGSKRVMRLQGNGQNFAWGAGPVFEISLEGEEIFLQGRAKNETGVGHATLHIEVSNSPTFATGKVSVWGSPTTIGFPTASVQTKSAVYSIPPGYAYARLRYYITDGATDVRIGGVVVRRRNKGELIVEGTIVSNHVKSDAIETRHIASDAVIARHILAGEVKADHLDANSVTSAKIESGAVKTAQLDAGAVTASKMLIGDVTNLVTDPYFSDLDYWTFPSGYLVEDSISTTWNTPRILRLTGDANQYLTAFGPSFEVTPGQKLFMSVQGFLSPAVGSCNMHLQVSENPNFSPAQYLNPGEITSGSITTSSGIVTVPAGMRYARVRLEKRNNGATVCRLGAPIVRIAASGELIVNGAIQANHVSTNEIITNEANIRDAIITDAKIANLSAAKIDTGIMNARHVEVTETLKLDATTAGFSVGKTSAGDLTTPGIYLGRAASGGADAFGLLAGGVNAAGMPEYLEVSKSRGTRLVNAKYYRDLSVRGATTTVTNSQTITLNPACQYVEVTMISGGNGGDGGRSGNYGPSLGGRGGQTSVRVFSGSTATADIRNAPRPAVQSGVARSHFNGGDGFSSALGTGGAGGEGYMNQSFQPVNNPGANATGYGAGGGGGSSCPAKDAGAGGNAAEVTTEIIDVSSVANAKLQITIGTAGAKGLGESGRGADGGNGSPGWCRITQYLGTPVRADVVPMSPTAFGTVSNKGPFPDLGGGMWVITHTNDVTLGTIKVNDTGNNPVCNSGGSFTFLSSRTPTVVSNPHSARTLNYQFFKMGD